MHKTRYVQSVRKELNSPKKKRLCAWRLAPAAFAWKLISLGRKIYFPKQVARHWFCQAANYQENCHLTRMIHKNFTAKRDDGKIFARRRSDWQGFGLFMSLAQSVDEHGGCREHFRWELVAVICARHCYRFFRSFQAILGLGKEIWMCVSRKLRRWSMQNGLLCWFYAKIIDFSLLQLRFSFSSRKFVVKLASKSSKDVYFHFPATSESDFAFANLDRQSRHAGYFFHRLPWQNIFFAFTIAKNMKAKVLCTKSIVSCRLSWHGRTQIRWSQTWLTLDSCQARSI